MDNFTDAENRQALQSSGFHPTKEETTCPHLTFCSYNFSAALLYTLPSLQLFMPSKRMQTSTHLFSLLQCNICIRTQHSPFPQIIWNEKSTVLTYTPSEATFHRFHCAVMWLIHNKKNYVVKYWHMCQILINDQGFDKPWKNLILFFRAIADSGRFPKHYLEISNG